MHHALGKRAARSLCIRGRARCFLLFLPRLCARDLLPLSFAAGTAHVGRRTLDSLHARHLQEQPSAIFCSSGRGALHGLVRHCSRGLGRRLGPACVRLWLEEAAHPLVGRLAPPLERASALEARVARVAEHCPRQGAPVLPARLLVAVDLQKLAALVRPRAVLVGASLLFRRQWLAQRPLQRPAALVPAASSATKNCQAFAEDVHE